MAEGFAAGVEGVEVAEDLPGLSREFQLAVVGVGGEFGGGKLGDVAGEVGLEDFQIGGGEVGEVGRDALEKGLEVRGFLFEHGALAGFVPFGEDAL